MNDVDPIASPSSTGGEGPYFEQHVNAYWLALLLVDAIPPIALDATISKVSFQTEHLGWHTDDVLVTTRANSGAVRQLACQVKKTLTIGAGEEFRGTIVDAWKDFSSGCVFREDHDAILIVTQLGTYAVLRDFAGLLDCARASSNAADFANRLATPGFVNADVRAHSTVIEKILDAHEGVTVPRERVRRFLQHVYVLSLDLNTATSQGVAHIKTLLAHTANEGDAAAAATATWNELLAEVGRFEPKAREYERGTLPASVLSRHSPISTKDRRALEALRKHSGVILSGIRTVVGSELHLPRPAIVTQLLEQLERSRVLLVSGVAGSGKSAVVKETEQVLAVNHFVFAFRAEELATAHFDLTLGAAQIGMSGRDLAAVLAAHPRKILIVESVERLLEVSSRDAFTDLLTFVRDDPTWRLLLTCRDYSVDLLRVAFLQAAAIPHGTLPVPPLTDDELRFAAERVPVIARLLENDRLRALLRNPYTLDMAVRIPWRDEDRLPESEREFRARFWHSFVLAEHYRERGMPLRRGETFMEICARRAQALTLFAPTAGLDAEALAALQKDGLVAVSAEHPTLAAPTHDVLEDWGVLEWIDQAYQRANSRVEEFAAMLGSFPAIRRTYRTWIAELLDRDPANADAFFDSVVAAASLPLHFRDDTIIAFLRSDQAPALLQRHAAALVADDKQLLRRVVHLLRVGCVTLPGWMPFGAATSILFQPEGRAWPSVLTVVCDNLAAFDGRDRLLLLGLVEDWAKGVSMQVPYPDGHEAAAAITLWVIARCGGYQSTELLKRALKALAKIPASDAEGFAAILRGRDDEERDHACEELREIVYDGIEGLSVARDLPDLLVEVGKDYFLATEEDLHDRYTYSPDIELFFGVRAARSHGYLPPSAFRGPFRPLLQHHPRAGRDFIVDLLNYCGQWYGKRLGTDRNIQTAFEITLTFADGTTKTQWANGRLWQLYRGTSATPYVLQSAAMALEAWIFEVAKADEKLLDPLLLQLLRASDSAAATAVAGSVAVAYPYACGETLLVLLSSPECIMLDRARMVSDWSGSPFPRLPQRDPMNHVFARERAEADAEPHRRQDLEMAIARLQASPFAARVHQALDRHRAALPPVEEQNEDDRVWRLALHRMDLRKYEPSLAEPNDGPTADANEQTAEQSRYIVLTPSAPEADLQAMMQESSDRHARVSGLLGNQMWGIKVFEGAEGTRYDPSEWRTRLAAVRASEDAVASADEMMFGNGATVIAAVCVRDHWPELIDDERAWCLKRLSDEIARTANDWSDGAQMPGFMNPAVPAATVTSRLVLQAEGAPEDVALAALAAGLTHPNREARLAAARAVGRDLWTSHRDLVLRCVHALRVEAMTFQRRSDADRKKPYAKREEVETLRAESAALARDIVCGRRPVVADDVSAFAPSNWSEADASVAILSILVEAPTDRVTLDAFPQIAATLVEWWNADSHDRSQPRERRSDETEYALKDLLAEGLFRVSDADVAAIIRPLTDAVDTHPDEVADILRDIIIREDRDPATERFWFLWRSFAEQVRNARWLPDIDTEYARGRQLLDGVLLARGWKENARHWKSLEGHAHHVHRLFEQLALSRAVLNRYLLFLYHVGEQSLPKAFVRLHARMRQGNQTELLAEGDSSFVLEALLLRFVYSKPFELKQRLDLRAAVLFLLDALVESGSSAAFRMRDDFVTPLPTPNTKAPPVRLDAPQSH